PYEMLEAQSPDGSVMVIVATDAPLDHRQLERLAKRAGLGLARTGFFSSNGSGDFFIAFSTAGRVPHDSP
ncbi:MAG TPA: aminopeptidase, partial [Firmicutes bacterium]|nr:aminopeptidase [Bacillota bacterium]